MTFIIIDTKTNREIRFTDMCCVPNVGESVLMVLTPPTVDIPETISGKVIDVVHGFNTDPDTNFVNIYIR